VQGFTGPPSILRAIASDWDKAVSFDVLSNALIASIQLFGAFSLSSYGIPQTVQNNKRAFLNCIEAIIWSKNCVGSTFGIRPLYRKLKGWVKKFTDLLKPETALSCSHKLPYSQLQVFTAFCLSLTVTLCYCIRRRPVMLIRWVFCSRSYWLVIINLLN
jgi:hypothetical protein